MLKLLNIWGQTHIIYHYCEYDKQSFLYDLFILLLPLQKFRLRDVFKLRLTNYFEPTLIVLHNTRFQTRLLPTVHLTSILVTVY